MTHPIDDQIALEARLQSLAEGIAALLRDPLTPARTTAIDRLWQDMARAYGPYQQGHAAIHPSRMSSDVPPDTPDQRTARVNFMRHGAFRAALWEKVPMLLERLATPYHRPLVTEEMASGVDRQSDLMSYLMQAMHALANPIAEDRAHTRANQFPDIGLSGGYFTNLMQAAYRITRARRLDGLVRFLDVGCGGGTKMIVASHFFEVADGLEYNSDYVAHAERTLELARAEGCTIIEGDALTFNDYSSYDVIYAFRPLSDRVMLAELETTILDQAKPGTLIIAPMGQSYAQSDRATHLGDVLYMAHTTAAEAATLRERAEAIGPDWQVQDAMVDQALGFWAPLIAVACQNGFCLPR